MKTRMTSNTHKIRRRSTLSVDICAGGSDRNGHCKPPHVQHARWNEGKECTIAVAPVRCRLPKGSAQNEILEGIQVDGRPLYRRTQPTRNWEGESADDGGREERLPVVGLIFGRGERRRSIRRAC